jgi:hypothetical protein
LPGKQFLKKLFHQLFLYEHLPVYMPRSIYSDRVN